ncbi:PREDICTED: cysteine and histidine-rich domain-containing protein-like [Cyphomyrmex costatus]|uniref:cysteine and histidine-rich domain-containing protein-like n=1 Tax=Cyphomyrmex costatus TaxID=456900 RepID=UPI0008522ABE|nr:PREDICTED: cysteine and histidine-rich domain-containing protein-like [Cyphomyrmex costatus]
MSQEIDLLHCYHRGCGKKFDPNDNKDDNCLHHPGNPVFHDAYKGWSCCNKKCIDFTEFLNIKGCTKSKHSNVKPLEPEKLPVDKCKVDEVIRVVTGAVSNGAFLERPPFNSSQLILSPIISPALLEQIKGLTALEVDKSTDSIIQIGQTCKNNSCKGTYTGIVSDEEVCNYHPGVPIFHEGLKYWSCCKKKTTEFSLFLDQPGCMQGKHIWFSKSMGKKAQCRMDWHQTGAYVVVSIFAKKYLPSQSVIKLNPIHLTVDLFFIEENSRYYLDIELKGIVNVEQSSVHMLPTKVEIKLKKTEPGSWPKLDVSTEAKPRNSETACSRMMLATKSKLRILALHGYMQSDVIFSAKLGSLRKGFKKEMEFTFIRAPHKVPSQKNKIGQEDTDENGYGWWFNTEDHVFKATVPSNLCVGFDDSVALIEKVFSEQGPFDGILGFSQGAAFVSILCAMKKKKILRIEFNFVIVISGFKSLCAPHAKYYDEEIDIPSLHIYGENDQVIPTVMAEQISCLFSNKKEIQHEGGHYVPSKKDIYRDFVIEMLSKCKNSTS